MVNYPSSLDSLANPTATTKRNDSGFEHHLQHSDANDILEALETKLGTGASTPSANTVLRGTGAGTTAYGQIVAADITPGIVTVMRLAEVTVGTGAPSTIDFTNIPQTYRHLLIELVSLNTTGATNVLMRFSSDGTTFDSGNNYDLQYDTGTAATEDAGELLAASSLVAGAHGSASNVMSPSTIKILDYTNAYQKSCLVQYSRKTGTTTGNLLVGMIGGYWRNTAAIQGVRLFVGSNGFAAGSRATLYGLPA